MPTDIITSYWTTGNTASYWGGSAGQTDNACRTDYLKLVARRSQKSREQTRGSYRRQFLSNTEIA